MIVQLNEHDVSLLFEKHIKELDKNETHPYR